MIDPLPGVGATNGLYLGLEDLGPQEDEVQTAGLSDSITEAYFRARAPAPLHP